LLCGPSNNKCFWPQPHLLIVQSGVPKPPVFHTGICECFFLYHMRFLIPGMYYSGNQAKYLILRLFVTLGQYYSEDRVFAWVLCLVFAWITPQSCIRHCCTYTRLYTGTSYVS
ncbi:unnamed protein product, partial [Laminaria digitata]